MKGKYHIIIQNNRVKFEFDIRRNITIIRGDSGSGKTTLMNLIETYERLGDDSGISISSEKECRTLNNRNWESVISESHECIIFIDEDTKAVTSTDFATKVKESDNYYVIISRENLYNLPYSVEEIYGIHTSGKYANIKQTYNSFYHLYKTQEQTSSHKADVVIVEDTNSGYEFFSSVINERVRCVSAGGKTRISKMMKEYKGCKILIIADGAAFGSEMSEIYNYMQRNPEVNIYLPESFEWIILASGVAGGKRVLQILNNPEEYIESRDYFSWEQFFTKLLVRETKDTYLHYDKKHLNERYLGNKEKNAILNVISVVKNIILDS
jgi:hypothetical protein